MKIIGFVYSESGYEMVLKGDSCLLNGRKPFFVPDWNHEVGVTGCMILRVSRLGKEIAPKFASRYYDAIAPGADFVAIDVLREAKASGRPWTRALAFDYSLAIGEWGDVQRDNVQGTKDNVQSTKDNVQSTKDDVQGTKDNVQGTKDYVLSPEEAISEASKVMTIRQGDLIYIQERQVPRVVQKEEIIRQEKDGKETLYCKIK